MTDRYVTILQQQVTGLVFCMVGVGQEDRGQLVEADDSVRLRILDAGGLRGMLELLVVRRAVAHGEGQTATEYVVLQEHQGAAQPEAEFMEAGAEVAGG